MKGKMSREEDRVLLALVSGRTEAVRDIAARTLLPFLDIQTALGRLTQRGHVKPRGTPLAARYQLTRRVETDEAIADARLRERELAQYWGGKA